MRRLFSCSKGLRVGRQYHLFHSEDKKPRHITCDIEGILLDTCTQVESAIHILCSQLDIPNVKYVWGVSNKNWVQLILRCVKEYNYCDISPVTLSTQLEKSIQDELVGHMPQLNKSLIEHLSLLKDQGHFCSLITNHSAQTTDCLLGLFANELSDLFDVVIADPSQGAKPSPRAYQAAFKQGPLGSDIIGFEHSIPGIYGFLKATKSMPSAKLTVIADEPYGKKQAYINQIEKGRQVNFLAADWQGHCDLKHDTKKCSLTVLGF